MAKFDNGSYSRLQFLRAFSHAMGAHTPALQHAHSDSDDDGDDSQSTAATPTTTSTAPHTAAHAAADTTVMCVSWHRAMGSRWYPADMRALLLLTCAQCAVATSP